ncbi:glutathione S-transferase [Vespertiliibacter pulmonis]|uniref:glutathione transferase n=1 Tax=Vespertiliibacter pulmonis TaxID=1443036 RepID=A0A3N4VHW0_9PAST|nr:glutathione S-transferase [Vespertiliibacter pulmonis]QLB20747.1 glutathione S-transferase [Vespertiliibacter pulmonis]RPE82632.1 glutathione S-transferase [Vespertiliibacter pulmonis]
MITLYALKQSRAYRIAWLLELLHLDYKIDVIERDSQTFLAPDRLRQIHPLGKSPLIVDGDLTLGESGAIVEYLLQRYGDQFSFKPAVDNAEYPNYLYWLHYAEGSIMPLLVMSLVFNRIDQQKVPFFIKPIVRKITEGVRHTFLTPQLKLHLDHIEQSLSGKTWFLGEQLTGADIMMSFPLQALVLRGMKDYPNIQRFVKQIQQDPAYQQAEQKIGKLTI